MKNLILLIALISWPVLAYPQIRDLDIARGRESVELPFEYVNDFIILTVYFNEILPLKFIFDTGAEYTLITKKEITDLLQVDYRKKYPLLGADLTTELYAYLATGVRLRIADFAAINRSILVLEEDYFKFEEYAGINIQGIIGSDLFRRFVVKIDYRKQKITLTDPSKFKSPGSKYKKLDIEIFRHKPYIFARTQLQNDTSFSAKLLLDTGAGLPLLLYTDTNEAINIPPKVIRSNIAMGLGGYIEGYLGRIQEIQIDEYVLNDVVTNFQDLMFDMDSLKLNDRNGIIGNRILNRFTIIIDYIRQDIYLKPQKKFNRKFKYDRSGMTVITSGENLNVYSITRVIPDSPADEAGVQPGDEIRSINGWPALFLTLDSINRKMRKKVGKKIQLILRRDGEKIKVNFKLRDLI
jgi:hypothetical protein